MPLPCDHWRIQGAFRATPLEGPKFWEGMVGLTKKCMKITLNLCSLSHDELAATLYEPAFHLNMRPLTTVDDELLTPAHLLFGVTSIRGVLSPSDT